MSVEFLGRRTWRDLRATARAYGLRFDNNLTRDQALFALRTALLDEGRLRRILRRLDKREREALMLLKAQAGAVGRWQFCRLYGEIRRYRPWRPDAPVHPWRRPISLAEKLWFLGLIEVDAHRAVLLPDEVAALLPPLPHPQRVEKAVVETDLNPAALVRDVAALLGTLLHRPVRLLHGRWLPPYTLKAINLRLSAPESLKAVRSELQTGRIRFLHYLATVAGLVSVQNGLLLPTAEAWNWLSLPYAQAHEQLREAIAADLHSRNPLWLRFRLPVLSASVWDFLTALPPGCYTLASLRASLRLKTLDPEAPYQLGGVLAGPLRWLGFACLTPSGVTVSAAFDQPAQPARLSLHPDTIGVALPPVPHLSAMVKLLSFAVMDERGIRLNQVSVSRAVENGWNAGQIGQVLAELTTAPLPEKVLSRLIAWERETCRVQIERQAVLTVADADVMRRIRADWRLRPFLGKQLSPHHILVRDEQALRQRLARRGYPVPPLIDRQADPLPLTNDSDPAYLWLAVRICQALADLVPAPVLFPGAAVKPLEQALGDRLDTLRSLVDAYVGQVRFALRGRFYGTPLLEQGDPNRIRAAVQAALDTASGLRIRYFSPHAGQETERLIEPQVMYERQGVTYIEAWCHLDDAPRTFRLDRILAVQP